jgi:hypothetical protein
MQRLMSLSGKEMYAFGYGISIIRGKSENPIWIDIDDKVQVIVRLNHLNILFPGGYMIEFYDGNEPQNEFRCELPKLSADQAYHVVLSVDPFKRIPFGDVDPAESPARQPFVLPDIQLSLLEKSNAETQNLGNNHLIIGQIRYDGKEWIIQEDYIPACQTISGSYHMRMNYSWFEKSLSAIEISTSEIVHKVRLKKQDNVLAVILSQLSDRMLSFISIRMAQVRIMLSETPPVNMVTLLMDLARVLRNTLDGWQECGRDEVMTYLSEWCGVSQGEFEDTINKTVMHRYDHNDIKSSIDLCFQFLDMVKSVFNSLAKLDFIGKKIDTDLFVKEEQQESKDYEGAVRKKGGFSSLSNISGR